MEGPRGAVLSPVCINMWEFSELHILKFLLSFEKRRDAAGVPHEAMHLRDAGSCCPGQGSASLDNSEGQKWWQQGGVAARMLWVSKFLSVVLVEQQFLRNSTV